MQRIILTTILFLSGIISANAQKNHTITVNFKAMKSDKGSLFVALYASKDSFLKKPIKTDIVKVSAKKAVVIFKNITTGTYAISAFQDINDNKKMDTNFFGIPKEPIGISNNATGFMGPPKYKDAKFNVTKNSTISINVK